MTGVSGAEVSLGELGPAVEVPLSLDQGRRLASSGVVTAVPSLERSGQWFVGPAGKVGAASIGDVTVRITPKVPIARLLFLLGYSLHGVAWLESTVSVGEAPDLVPAVASALWRQAERAVHQGLLPGYVVVEDSGLVLRGRLLEGAQLSRHHGLPLPLEIRHDEFTIDIAENQILRTALERMLQVPRVDAESARMFRRLLRDFSDVSVIPRGDPAPAWSPTRLNARYQVALRLAELVLRATSVEHTSGTVAVNGFLLDMPQLFEDFVTVALREALEGSYGGRVVSQYRHYLDVGGRVPMRPDIVWESGGAVLAVADAKYKSEKPSGYPNADLYQLLAYCTVLGLPVGHLVYAAGNETPVRHIVRQAGTTIICHALDLDQAPDLLLADVHGLAEEIASSCAAAMQLLVPLAKYLDRSVWLTRGFELWQCVAFGNVATRSAYDWDVADVGRRNPDWEWDEIVLACDLVARNDWRQIDHSSPKVAELSNLLQRMSLHPEESRLPNFRSESSVARKTADIATWHPDYQGRHTNGNRLDREVMAKFLAEPDVMHATAESIREFVAKGEPPDFPRTVGYEDESAFEGRYLLRLHAYRERNPALRRKKIAAIKAQTGGPLVCEVCKFDFARTYGDRGQDYIECHHVEPLHVSGEKVRSIKDLALLCSNCHRMIHRKPPWPTPAELRELIERQARP